MNRTHRDSLSPSAGPLCARLAATLAALVALAAPSSASMIFDDGGVHDVTTEIVGNVIVRDSAGNDPTGVSFNAGGDVGGDLIVEDTSVVVIDGGSVARDLLAIDDTTVWVRQGSVGRFFRMAGTSLAFVTGGEIVGTVGAQGESRIEVFGGVFGDSLVATDEGVLTIYGDNFAIDGVPVPEGPLNTFGQLTGTLRNNMPIDNEVDATGNGAVVLVQAPIIPEPTTALMLIAIASCGLVRREF